MSAGNSAIINLTLYPILPFHYWLYNYWLLSIKTLFTYILKQINNLHWFVSKSLRFNRSHLEVLTCTIIMHKIWSTCQEHRSRRDGFCWRGSALSGQHDLSGMINETLNCHQQSWRVNWSKTYLHTSQRSLYE